MSKEPTVPARPKIPDYFYVVPIGNDRLQFRAGPRVVRLGGKAVSQLFPKLLPLLNGRYQVSEITSELKEFKEETILAALTILRKKGLLEDASAMPSFDLSPQELKRYDRHFSFFSHFNDDRYEYQGILKSAKVAVLGLGQVGAQVLSSLAACGIGEIRVAGDGVVEGRDLGSFYTEAEIGKTKREAAQLSVSKINPHVQVESVEGKVSSVEDAMDLIDGADLVIVCVDGPSISIFRWVNEACLTKKIRWTSASLNGNEAIIGPSIVPFETACYTCYELRRKANETFYEEYLAFEKYMEDNPDLVREYGSIPSLSEMVGGYVALEAIKILTDVTFPVTCGRICTVNFLSLETDVEEVLKLPYCPTCSQAKPKPKLWLEE